MTERNLEEIQYKEITDKIVDYIIHTKEGTSVTLTRLRDLAMKNGKYPGVGYSMLVQDIWHGATRRFRYTEKSYRDLYRRLIRYGAVSNFLKPEMSLEEVELQLAIRGH